MKDKKKETKNTDIVDRFGEQLGFSLKALAKAIDPSGSAYALTQLNPYNVDISRIKVDSPDEISVALYCKVSGIPCGDLVLRGTFVRGMDKLRRGTIFIQYDGHPETLGYDFHSISAAIYVMRLYSQGKPRGAKNRMLMTAESIR